MKNRKVKLIFIKKLIFILAISSQVHAQSNTCLESPDLKCRESVIYKHQEGKSRFTDLYTKAGNFLHKRDLVRAEQTYRKIVLLEPNKPSGYTGIGTCRLNGNDLFGAEQYYKKALQIDSNSTGALVGMGSVSYRRKNYSDAINWYKRAININPDLAHAYRGLGISYHAINQSELSVKYLLEFLRLAPSSNLTESTRKKIEELSKY